MKKNPTHKDKVIKEVIMRFRRGILTPDGRKIGIKKITVGDKEVSKRLKRSFWVRILRKEVEYIEGRFDYLIPIPDSKDRVWIGIVK